MYYPLYCSLRVISSPFFLSRSVFPSPHPLSPFFLPFLHAPLIFISQVLICEHMRQRNQEAGFCVIANTQQNVSATRMIAYALGHPGGVGQRLKGFKVARR